MLHGAGRYGTSIAASGLAFGTALGFFAKIRCVAACVCFSDRVDDIALCCKERYRPAQVMAIFCLLLFIPVVIGLMWLLRERYLHPPMQHGHSRWSNAAYRTRSWSTMPYGRCSPPGLLSFYHDDIPCRKDAFPPSTLGARTYC